jgi:RHS repeat-associated protein
VVAVGTHLPSSCSLRRAESRLKKGIPVRVQSPPSFTEGPGPDKAWWEKALSEKSFSVRKRENSQQNQHVGAKSPTTHLGPFGELLRATGPMANANPIRWSSKYQDDETDLLYYGYRFEKDGRWISRDPISEKGGLNLYGFVGNDSVNALDVLGLDFIAVADRPVKGLGGTVYHYSIQYWFSCGSEAPVTETRIEWWLNSHLGSKKVGSVELLRDTGWRVWAKKTGDGFWTLLDTSVSVIHFSDSGDNFISVLSGSPANVRAKWKLVEQLAKSYAYAEQQGFNGTFRHWPNSKYGTPSDLPFNNSNTFVRDTVGKAGLTMVEMNGSHPGNDSPVPVPDIYAGQLPFQGPGSGHSPDY